MDRFFQDYVSDTTAGMAAQTMFDGTGEHTLARVYVRLTHDGEELAMLFSGSMDATFGRDGSTKVGDMCDPFEIVSLRVGVCDSCSMAEATEPSAWEEVTWDGAPSSMVYGGDVVATDPIFLTTKVGDTLCIEYTFWGFGRIPCHAELQIPSFVKTADRFVPSAFLPVPVMLGVRRAVSHRLAFLGDSITQGIGATPGAYRHWVALVGDRLDPSVSCYNLGIGFARSGDAAQNGMWLSRAKMHDTVVLCLGVNDILRGVPSVDIAGHITTVIMKLQAAGCRVLLQSIPPFEFSPEQWAVWRDANTRIKGMGDVFFDNTAFLCDGDSPRYGGHPNDAGCAVWADAITPVIQSML